MLEGRRHSECTNPRNENPLAPISTAAKPQMQGSKQIFKPNRKFVLLRWKIRGDCGVNNPDNSI